MPRQKRRGEVKRLPPIELLIDQPDQKAVWDRYLALTATGQGSGWVRAALVAALPGRKA